MASLASRCGSLQRAAYSCVNQGTRCLSVSSSLSQRTIKQRNKAVESRERGIELLRDPQLNKVGKAVVDLYLSFIFIAKKGGHDGPVVLARILRVVLSHTGTRSTGVILRPLFVFGIATTQRVDMCLPSSLAPRLRLA